MHPFEMPPMPGSLLLRDGRVFVAKTIGEMLEEEHSSDFQLAKSKVGDFEISTVFLRMYVHGIQGRESSPGDELFGITCFETMVSRRNEICIERHRSVEESVDFHLQARREYAEQEGLPAEWILKPYRCQNHGQPTPEIILRLEQDE